MSNNDKAVAKDGCYDFFARLHRQVMIKRPSTIYLGQIERDMLRQAVERAMPLVPDVIKQDRDVFCDVPIYVVDAHSHIGFDTNVKHTDSGLKEGIMLTAQKLERERDELREWIMQTTPILSAVACIVSDEAVERLDEIAGVRGVLELCPVDFLNPESIEVMPCSARSALDALDAAIRLLWEKVRIDRTKYFRANTDTPEDIDSRDGYYWNEGAERGYRDALNLIAGAKLNLPNVELSCESEKHEE